MYFQTHIEKGNDLLEEASTLAQSGDFDEVTGYKELARMLKRHLQQFSERLEEARERIEGTTKCYQLLDKVSYRNFLKETVVSNQIALIFILA